MPQSKNDFLKQKLTPCNTDLTVILLYSPNFLITSCQVRLLRDRIAIYISDATLQILSKMTFWVCVCIHVCQKSDSRLYACYVSALLLSPGPQIILYKTYLRIAETGACGTNGSLIQSLCDEQRQTSSLCSGLHFLTYNYRTVFAWR